MPGSFIVVAIRLRLALNFRLELSQLEICALLTDKKDIKQSHTGTFDESTLQRPRTIFKWVHLM